ncbi:hypothetical protein QBC47DRAFT_416415 [Echria macrotheca]|uniref:Uncharacterized protein n=1 Tax=Echria macrotheca TaxID=438768 RepID=A0AAJ0B9R9_9PEZI|nr:hypothetical protein QBC47DRAFT_416415 [Echria macrotheca]
MHLSRAVVVALVASTTSAVPVGESKPLEERNRHFRFANKPVSGQGQGIQNDQISGGDGQHIHSTRSTVKGTGSQGTMDDYRVGQTDNQCFYGGVQPTKDCLRQAGMPSSQGPGQRADSKIPYRGIDNVKEPKDPFYEKYRISSDTIPGIQGRSDKSGSMPLGERYDQGRRASNPWTQQASWGPGYRDFLKGSPKMQDDYSRYQGDYSRYQGDRPTVLETVPKQQGKINARGEVREMGIGAYEKSGLQPETLFSKGGPEEREYFMRPDMGALYQGMGRQGQDVNYEIPQGRTLEQVRSPTGATQEFGSPNDQNGQEFKFNGGGGGGSFGPSTGGSQLIAGQPQRQNGNEMIVGPPQGEDKMSQVQGDRESKLISKSIPQIPGVVLEGGGGGPMFGGGRGHGDSLYQDYQPQGSKLEGGGGGPYHGGGKGHGDSMYQGGPDGSKLYQGPPSGEGIKLEGGGGPYHGGGKGHGDQMYQGGPEGSRLYQGSSPNGQGTKLEGGGGPWRGGGKGHGDQLYQGPPSGEGIKLAGGGGGGPYYGGGKGHGDSMYQGGPEGSKLYQGSSPNGQGTKLEGGGGPYHGGGKGHGDSMYQGGPEGSKLYQGSSPDGQGIKLEGGGGGGPWHGGGKGHGDQLYQGGSGKAQTN